jgi:hypothetical protein
MYRVFNGLAKSGDCPKVWMLTMDWPEHTPTQQIMNMKQKKTDDGLLFVLSCDFIVLAHWNNNNSPQVDMSSYWNNKSSLQVDMSSHWNNKSSLQVDMSSHWNNNNSPQVDMSSYWNNNNSPQVDMSSHWNNNKSPQVDMSSHWNNNNSPQVDMSSHWGTLCWFRANQLLLKKIFVNLVLNFIN